MVTRPFSYFGSKVSVAPLVWKVFGTVHKYVEPFFGSGAILFARPSSSSPIFEIVNDRDGFIVNFWRAVKHDPESVSLHADQFKSSIDFWSIQAWLISQKQDLVSKLESNKDYYDPEVAGLWVWGMTLSIRGCWCKEGPSSTDTVPTLRPRIAVSEFGQGVNADINVKDRKKFIFDMLLSLSIRLKEVRVLCGSWDACLTTGVIRENRVAAVFLDPPYSPSLGRSEDLYSVDSLTVAQDVGRWCKENESNTYLKIALCGYEGEHPSLSSWSTYSWSSNTGVSTSADNRHKERIWFSPSCNYSAVMDEVDLFNQFNI